MLVTYADDFVILCRHGADEVLETTRRWMTRIGLALNEDKTRLLDARCAAFDFLGYTFGPTYSPRTGGRYNGVRPSNKAVASIRDAIRQRLRPGNQAAWEDVVGAVNRTVRGWCHYFSYGTVTKARHDVALHLYHTVRRFLRRPAQDRRVWLSAVPHASGLWGTGCPVASDSLAPAAAHAVA